MIFLYAGQGSQKVGMGADFYREYEEYRKIAQLAVLDFDSRRLMEEGPQEQLSQTEYTQPCMAIFAAGVTEILKKHGIVPTGACGLSLGEYGALYAAGVMDAKAYIEILAFRGKAMAEAAKGTHCCMSAILGLNAEDVELGCEVGKEKGFVTVANYNCPKQYVICGEKEAVAAAEAYLKGKGAKRCVRLQVSGPFHTKYMAPAGKALREYMQNFQFNKPQIPVTLNVTGDFYQENQDLRELLVQQVQSSVHLEQDLMKFLDAGEDTFVEIGPGNALTGFLKKIAKERKQNLTVYSIETVEDLKKLL
ncbi:MAG: ACP S-malonyltransferase [Lachnospiraceae bacterium]